MFARAASFVIWALVAATLVFWGMRLSARAPQAPAHVVAVGEATAVRADLSRLLGAPPPVVAAAPVAQPEQSARFKLLGIVAPKASTESSEPYGVALIAVDGKPARAYRVGARVDNDWILQSVSMRTAAIGPSDGAPVVKLEMPPLVPAATGTLPPIGGAASTGIVPPPSPAAPPRPVPARPAAVVPGVPALPPMALPPGAMPPPGAGAAQGDPGVTTQ